VLQYDAAVKRFGSVVALDECTFFARPGRLTGFLGPNGAGKTTAMRAVFGLVDLDAGAVRWRGAPLARPERARRVRPRRRHRLWRRWHRPGADLRTGPERALGGAHERPQSCLTRGPSPDSGGRAVAMWLRRGRTRSGGESRLRRARQPT
jgi:energy-coupling factor transporter ATP-binding protein EcfA2